MEDDALRITPDKLAALEALTRAPKFGAELTSYYPGAASEELRIECERDVNDLLAQLAAVLAIDPRKSVVLDAFRTALISFQGRDTEERERVCGYLEQIMDILDIESSDGLLNEWLYNFNPDAISD